MATQPRSIFRRDAWCHLSVSVYRPSTTNNQAVRYPASKTYQDELVLITNLIHNSFILQYMYYIKYLDMFRAILCSSSGGQNCIFTASGIITLYEWPCSAPVES
jgi:hypothetical protein